MTVSQMSIRHTTPEPSAAAALARRTGVRMVGPAPHHRPADDVPGELFPSCRSDRSRPKPHRVAVRPGQDPPIAADDVARVVATVLADPGRTWVGYTS